MLVLICFFFFSSSGDLKDYVSEISDIFVKCFSQLNLQAPIIATLLALVHHKDAEFSSTTVSKLQEKLIQSLGDDDVVTSRNVLKAFACIASCSAFVVSGEGENSLLFLLNAL